MTTTSPRRGAMETGLRRAEEWLTGQKRSLYGISVTRMILGFVVWSQLVANWPDRQYTWGDGARWTSPVQDQAGWPSFLGAFDALSGRGFDALYLLTIVAGVSLMLGWFTRASAVLTLVLWMSLYVTNPFVGSGGDAVLRMVLLYLCFTDAGRIWSLDARREQRRAGRAAEDREPRRPFVPSWMSSAVHNLALVLIIHQVVMVYVGSAFWKLSGPLWTEGTAVYYPLQTEAFSPWGDLLQPLIAWSPFVLGGTYVALVVQLFFPVFLIYRPTRFLALIVITGMHLGIGLLMGILYFSLVMIAVDMILVSDQSWRRAMVTVRYITGRVRRARELHSEI
ncbi:HTTM domain-containing protein [Aeromicrobium sp. CF3.5]|uniref:HTTM domain-containing protein n=1 Tax=Aeromicrobium sp. CF3.5 TaxID=3373078 RepID=UPI003EE7DFF4